MSAPSEPPLKEHLPIQEELCAWGGEMQHSTFAVIHIEQSLVFRLVLSSQKEILENTEKNMTPPETSPP